MSKFTPEQQGLKQKLLMDKLKTKLDETQSEGKERIIFLVRTLLQELKNQGYNVKEESQLISIFLYLGEFDITIDSKRVAAKINEEEKNNEQISIN